MPKFKMGLTASLLAALLACQSPQTVEKKQERPAPPAPVSADPLIAGFEKTTVASVSDAVDQVTGRRGHMSQDMRAYVGTRFVGRVATALVRPANKAESTPARAIQHSVQMIDEAKPGDVGVIVMEKGLDIAALGGLMGTAAKARGMAGMVLDGSVRDIAELRSLGLPVFARGASPATAVGRFLSASKNVPVQCAGVTVKPGDVIVAGEDGVVVVPSESAEAVLKRAQEIDERETKMVPHIKEHKSLQKAIEVFNRI